MFDSKSKVEILFDKAIKSDNTFNINEQDFLKKSISKFVFEAYCKNFTGNYLGPLWSNSILQIINENVDYTSDVTKMDTLSKILIHAVLSNISRFPYPIWKFLSLLSSNTVVDTYSFFMVNFLAKAIKSPNLYNLVEVPYESKNNSKLVLKSISSIIKNYGRRSQFSYKNCAIDQELLNNCEKIISQWYLLGEPVKNNFYNEIDWDTSRGETMLLLNWILQNDSRICEILVSVAPFSRYIESGSEELIKSLLPLPEPEPEPETTSQQIPSLAGKKKEGHKSLAQRVSTIMGKKKKVDGTKSEKDKDKKL